MGTGAGMTTCRLVLNGSLNQPQSVQVVDDYVSGSIVTGEGGDVVKVNALALLCDVPALGATKKGLSTGSPIVETDNTRVACYTVSGADSARIQTTVATPFTEVNAVNGVENVALGAIQLLCVPAAIQ